MALRSGVIAAAGVAWFVVFAILRIITARIGRAANRGSLFELLTSMGWLLERNQPWTRLGWFCVGWLLIYPPFLAIVVFVFLQVSKNS
jgi:hypothetical protein